MWIILTYVATLPIILALLRWTARRNWKTIDKSNEIDILGKIVLITGANSGIGKITAYQLADRGAHVVLGCRDMGKGNDAMIWIRERTVRGELHCMQLDLSSLHSIRQFCNDFKQSYDKLHILVNNAGVYFTEDGNKTADGFEIHMGVNHLGHFLLTNLLTDLLKQGAPSRILTLTSFIHVHGKIDFNNLMTEKKSSLIHSLFHPCYINSKLANVLFTKELSKRLKGSGVNCYALCPGMVDTGLGRNFNGIKGLLLKIVFPVMKLIAIKTAEEGADTTLYCALSKHVGDQTGEVYRDCRVWDLNERLTLDDRDGVRLWGVSEGLVGVR